METTAAAGDRRYIFVYTYNTNKPELEGRTCDLRGMVEKVSIKNRPPPAIGGIYLCTLRFASLPSSPFASFPSLFVCHNHTRIFHIHKKPGASVRQRQGVLQEARSFCEATGHIKPSRKAGYPRKVANLTEQPKMAKTAVIITNFHFILSFISLFPMQLPSHTVFTLWLP